MDAAQWAQEDDVRSSNEGEERKVKPQIEQALNCPRCNSNNTKFCYYNNYSLTQPRYFCKACKRYWTQGGSLRNVPVGGTSRKNKRSTSSQFSSQTLTTHKGQDLNLGFQATQQEYHHHGFSQLLKMPKIETSNTNELNFLSSNSTTLTPVLAQHLLTYGGLSSFETTNMSDSDGMFNRIGFNLQEFKPTMGFPFHVNGSLQGNQEDGGRIMLPFGVLNQQLSSTREGGQSQTMGQKNPTGYWNGTSDGGSC